MKKQTFALLVFCTLILGMGFARSAPVDTARALSSVSPQTQFVDFQRPHPKFAD
jgi:hypothetical protein